MTSCDLAGCYDRIIHIAADLVLLRIGISHACIHSMVESIQKMINRIRTTFSDYDITCWGDDIGNWENESQGVLQGNTAGSDIWSALGLVIFDVLHTRVSAEKMISAIS